MVGLEWEWLSDDMCGRNETDEGVWNVEELETKLWGELWACLDIIDNLAHGCDSGCAKVESVIAIAGAVGTMPFALGDVAQDGDETIHVEAAIAIVAKK